MDDPQLRPNATPPSGGFDMNRPTIINLLYIGSIITGITGIVGVVLAYVWKGEPHEPWEATHYQYLINTFWIGLVASIISFVLMIVLIGFLLIFAVGIWFIVRVVMSMIAAQKRQPMPNPGTLFI